MNPEIQCPKLGKKLRNRFDQLVGATDFLFVTLDTLRYDAAQSAWQDGKLKTLGPYLGEDGWECRHTPASFTYAAHHAFFSGFLPTPASSGSHPRLFASRFAGSESTDAKTFVFDEPTLPEALAKRGYHTICIGGTGFFNPSSALGQVLPAMFSESHWSMELGVTDQESEINQIRVAIDRLAANASPTFTFINIAAIHQPNWFYGSMTPRDTIQTHQSALVAVDRALDTLFSYCRSRRKTFCIICSDHGTTYGEDGYFGHRCGHEVVWNVPYKEFMV